MFDLDNIHPYYLSIKPEVLVIEMTVQFDSIKVTLTENNTDKVSLFDSSIIDSIILIASLLDSVLTFILEGIGLIPNNFLKLGELF